MREGRHLVRVVRKLLRIALGSNREAWIMLHWVAGSVGVHDRGALRRLGDAGQILIALLRIAGLIGDSPVSLAPAQIRLDVNAQAARTMGKVREPFSCGFK